MLLGTADVDDLLTDAPVVEAFSPDGIELGEVTCFQLSAEMRNISREALLPPGLHPTIPASLTVQFWDVGTSNWGRFSMVVVRVSCRSGVRARGLSTRAICSDPAVTDDLRAIWGFPAVSGEVELRSSYHGVDATAVVDGDVVLEASGLDPDPMGLSDVQYTGTLNLAHTPRGPRLVQVEAHHLASRVERLQPYLHTFDSMALGHNLLLPAREVAATVATESVSIPAVRFVCSVDELAFNGTEAV